MNAVQRNVVACAAAVGVLTLVLFLPCLHNGLVNWDDDIYLLQIVPRSPSGLRVIGWAFSTVVPFYYHPLTWLSHVLDLRLWGQWWTGHHAVSVGIHGLNAALAVWMVWLLLAGVAALKEKERLALAILVALVFGIHPLQVESVAWLAERKNLLCGFFLLSMVIAYLRAVQTGAAPCRRWSVILLFLGALLSKPMAVPMPVVLLALDGYPLRRHQAGGWGRLWREKWFLFLLSAVCAGLTVVGQTKWGAVKEWEGHGVWVRSLVALRGLVFYIWKLIWPSWLSAYYPLGSVISLANREFWVPLLAIVAVTAVALWGRRRVPSLLAGWVAYVALIAPVSGLIQVGGQAVADRFGYVAILPLGLVIAGGLLWFWRRASWIGRSALSILVGCELVFFAFQTQAMIPVWRSEETMWRHVLRHYPSVGIANFHMAMALFDQRQFAAGLPYAEYAVELDPENPFARAAAGQLYLKTGQYAAAAHAFEAALGMQADLPAARYSLACAYARLGRWAEAWQVLKGLLASHPEFASASAVDKDLKGLREQAVYGPQLERLLLEVRPNNQTKPR